jgi:hypothetical protein
MMGRPDYFYKVQIVESGDSGFNRGDITLQEELIIKIEKMKLKIKKPINQRYLLIRL